MTTPHIPEPEALYERFTVTYPSGTVIESFYAGGATLREVQVTHPLAVVETIEESSCTSQKPDIHVGPIHG